MAVVLFFCKPITWLEIAKKSLRMDGWAEHHWAMELLVAAAGGTIIMDINSYSGAVTIEANGAQGGTANDGGNVGRCYGAGGGGSGGVIYFTGATPAVTVTANPGAAGPEIGREASCGPIVPAIAGAAGQIVPSYTVSIVGSHCQHFLRSFIASRADLFQS